MLLISIKKAVTLLLLLSLFGQAVASGLMSCKMELDKQLQSHTDCMSNMVTKTHDNDHEQEFTMDHDMSDGISECAQDCECCLGACSSNVSMPTNLMSLNQASLIKAGYKNRALINRTESLYRPPITC